MNYQGWLDEVPQVIREDILWKLEAYRLSLFLGDISWQDVTRLVSDRRTVSLSDQLYRAAGNISSNVGEGYSRSSSKDRARFYEYALGSARESRDWYYKARHVLELDIISHRLDLTTRIIRLLLTMIHNEHKSLKPRKPS